MIPGQAPPSGAVGPVELQQPVDAPVRAHRAADGLVFLHARFRHEQAQLQHLQHIALRAGKKRAHRLFVERIGLRALSLQPFLKLRGAVGVGKPGQFAGALRGLFPVLFVALDGARYQHGIDHDAPVVDLLIQAVQFLFLRGDGIALQPCPYLPLSLHVADAVFLEALPLLRGVFRQVARALAVGLGGLAGQREVAHEVAALFELFPLDAQHLAHALQRQRQRQHRRLHGGTLPLRGIQTLSETAADTGTLERRVEGRLGDGRVGERIQYAGRELFATFEVYDLRFLIIEGVGEEEDLEAGMFRVGVYPAFGQVDFAVRLDVTAQYVMFSGSHANVFPLLMLDIVLSDTPKALAMSRPLIPPSSIRRMY